MGLKGNVLHHHVFGDWVGLQADVTTWLEQWDGPQELFRFVGLEPWPEE